MIDLEKEKEVEISIKKKGKKITNNIRRSIKKIGQDHMRKNIDRKVDFD